MCSKTKDSNMRQIELTNTITALQVQAACLGLTVFLLCMFASPLVFASDVLRGRVVGVTDGDTLTLIDANKVQHKVRLSGIDAPDTSKFSNSGHMN